MFGCRLVTLGGQSMTALSPLACHTCQATVRQRSRGNRHTQTALHPADLPYASSSSGSVPSSLARSVRYTREMGTLHRNWIEPTCAAQSEDAVPC